MAHEVRLVKEQAEPVLWAQLRTERADLLRDVPTAGRCIAWDDLAGGRRPVRRGALRLVRAARRASRPRLDGNPPRRLVVAALPRLFFGGFFDWCFGLSSLLAHGAALLERKDPCCAVLLQLRK